MSSMLSAPSLIPATRHGTFRCSTVAELAAIGPDWLVPAHCTGWRATHELARALPEAYVQTSVGTTLHFAGT